MEILLLLNKMSNSMFGRLDELCEEQAIDGVSVGATVWRSLSLSLITAGAVWRSLRFRPFDHADTYLKKHSDKNIGGRWCTMLTGVGGDATWREERDTNT